ncbi:UNVERIFIED_ORG: type I restriction enzyme S subunit [Rhizobium aethiopicum]
MNAVSKISAFPPTVQPGLPQLRILPTGWSREPIGRHIREVRRPVFMIDTEVYQLVTAKRARGGIVPREKLSGREISVKSQFRIEEGDFLISKRQIVHGACGLVPRELDGAIVSNEYGVLRARPSMDSRFLSYLSHSIYFQQTCFHSAIGVHIEKMIFKLDKWLEREFALPPLPEQKKIAEILSTWDKAIETTAKLLANAEAQKRSLMQQLLTGKRRLKGFERSEWREVRLRDIARVIVSNVDKKSSSDELPVRLCNYTDVYKRDFILPTQKFMEATATAEQVRKFRLKVDDVIITKDSETADDIAMPTYVAETANDLICGYHLAIIRPGKDADGRFLKFIFELPHTRHYFGTRANGAIRYGLTIDGIERAEIRVPPIEEQKRIAAVLVAAEETISDHRREIRLLKTAKASLMQQLLTGRRRVTL